eukprot:1280757-Rhodomonas_salina.1
MTRPRPLPLQQKFLHCKNNTAKSQTHPPKRCGLREAFLGKSSSGCKRRGTHSSYYCWPWLVVRYKYWRKLKLQRLQLGFVRGSKQSLP